MRLSKKNSQIFSLIAAIDAKKSIASYGKPYTRHTNVYDTKFTDLWLILFKMAFTTLNFEKI